MAWNGAGVYSPPAATFPEQNGTIVDANRYNPTILDLAAGITNAVAKDGQNIPTNNLPMGGLKHTGAGNAAAVGEYLTYGQALPAQSSATFTGAVVFDGATHPVRNTASGLPARYVMIQQGHRQWSIGTPASGTHFTLRDDTGGFDLLDITPGAAGATLLAGPLGIVGAFTGATTGAFSNGVTMGALTASTGAFSEAVTFAAGVTFNGATQPVRNTTNGTPARFVLIQQTQRQWSIGTPASGTHFTIRDDSGGFDLLDITPGAVGAALFAGPLGIVGAFTGATTGAFSGAVSMAGLTATTGAFSSTVTAPSIDLGNGAVADLFASTYTPTLTLGANAAASNVKGPFQYLRVGNVVTVSGDIEITPTAANTTTLLGISLPVASALASEWQCCGVGVSAPQNPALAGNISADAGNDRAQLAYSSGAVLASTWLVHFTYLVV